MSDELPETPIPPSLMSLSEIKRINEENNNLRFENSQIKKSIETYKKTVIGYRNEIDEKDKKIAELEDALKKSTFVTASKFAATENTSVPRLADIAINNARYRILLQVKTVDVTVKETGEYLIYSDPVGRKLELRKKHDHRI